MAPVAEVQGIAKRFGDRVALEDVSFAIPAGEVVAVTGLNGAGKTTSLKILLGLCHPDRGRVTILPEARRRYGDVAFLPEDSHHPPDLTAGEIVALHASLAAASLGARRVCEETLERAGLAESASVRAGVFSKGMARRLGLAAAIVLRPELLVLDEPQSGLDPLGREDLRGIIRDERARGAAVILATHDLAEAEDLADRIIVIHEGRTLTEIPASLLDKPGALRERYLALIGRGTSRS